MKNLKLLFLLLLFAISACQKYEEPDCVQGQPKLIFCAENYDPVCGCNKKTYSNSCHAEADGISQFTKGACKN